MDLASREITQLTDNEKAGGFSSKPNFSPDGTHIVYEQVIRNAGRQIYIIDVKTRAARNFLPPAYRRKQIYPALLTRWKIRPLF